MGRTTATILFTDLVGSTELRGRLGEEAADELLRSHERLLTEAVEAHQGRVVKGLGDGIMATFTGASDGVAAGEAIQQAVERLNRTGKAPAPLGVRVGLSAGDVSLEDEDAHGTPVIEAARLCAAAGGGEILVSEVVRLLAGLGDGGLVDRGRLELKGLQQSVAAWAVGWEPAGASTIPMPALLADVGRVFVGRDGELERLGRLWKEAVAGERRVALLAGEPGIGKTRLASVAARRAHEEGSVVLAGRCDEDLGVPYQPFVEALRHHVVNVGSEARLGRYAGELVRLVPDVAEAMPGLPPPLRSDPETERYRLFDAVAAWLAAVSAEEPLLLVLDDLQWAAKPTLLLLRHVLRSAEGMSLLVVATYRDSDVGRGHPLAEFMADLRREQGVERMSLTGLDAAGVADYLVQAAGHDLDDAGQELARLVWRETEGSPFFVSEVMRHLAESGAVEQRAGRWVVTAALDELGIPEGVRDVVGRRLSRLSDEANRVLACASVIGLEFEPAVIQNAGGFDEDVVLAALEEAAAARLITEVQGPALRNRFAHGLVRATLYDELTAARRVALHHKVAEAIETLHAQALDDYLPALAHHWARASAPAADTARAVDYATRAGDRALTQLAHDEAVAYYRSALELLGGDAGPANEARRLGLLVALGNAQCRAGDAAHRATLLDAAHLAQQRGDAEALALAAVANQRGIHSVSGWVDSERAGVLEAALDAIGPKDSGQRARILASLAAELGFAPDHERRQRLSTEALAMARRLGDRATLGHVLARRWAVMAPTAPDERRAEVEELSEVAEELGDPHLAFWASYCGSWAALMVRDMDRYCAGLEHSDRLARGLGQPFLRWMVGYAQSARSRLAGCLEEAEARAGEALEVGQACGIPDAFHIYGSNLFCIRYDQGRLGEVVQLLRRATARDQHNPLTPGALAVALCELDQRAEAAAVFESVAADDFGALPRNVLWLYGLTVAAEACAWLGDRERATVLHERLAPHCGLIAGVGPTISGCVDHYVALLAAALGNLEEAEACFTASEGIHARLGAPTLLARTRLEWARMLLTRRQPADGGRARELLEQALATARELGLGGVERRAVALLEQT